MNDLEERLASVLRDAVPQPDVPAGLLHAAAARATQIRRRRVAVRSAVGAVAVLGGTATLARVGGAPADQGLSPAASAPAQPAQPAVGPSGAVRLLHEHVCSPALDMPPGTHCTRVAIELTDAAGTVRRFEVAERGGPESPAPAPVPVRLTVVFADGSEQVAVARQEGPDAWVFDVSVPAGAQVSRFTLSGHDGSHMTAIVE